MNETVNERLQRVTEVHATAAHLEEIQNFRLLLPLYEQKLQMWPLKKKVCYFLLSGMKMHFVIFVSCWVNQSSALWDSDHWLLVCSKVEYGTQSLFPTFCSSSKSSCFVSALRRPALIMLGGGGERLPCSSETERLHSFISTLSWRIKRLSLRPPRISSSLVDLTLTQEEVCSPA